MLRAVIFDMDDTLLDWSAVDTNWREFTQSCLQPVADYLGAAGHKLPAMEQVVEVYGQQVLLAWEIARRPDWDAPRQIDILSSTLKALGISLETIDLGQVERLFGWRLRPGTRAFPDSRSVLQTLRQAGLKTALLTNAALPMWMREPELAAFDLLDELDVCLSAGDIGKLKPHPRAFHTVLDQLGVLPDEAIMVGDSPTTDIAGAQASGMRGVWVRRNANGLDGTVKPNAVIDKLSELFDVLDLWYPGWRRGTS